MTEAQMTPHETWLREQLLFWHGAVHWNAYLNMLARAGITAIVRRDGTHRDCPGCRGMGK